MSKHSQPTVLFRNARVIDGSQPEPLGDFDILVEAGTIREVSGSRIQASCDLEYDLKGQCVMPGLIDLHIHPFLTDMNLMRLEETPISLVTAQASVVLKGLLDRGFTTIRDAAGGDWGLKQAVDEGLIAGPRLFISGRALSQTGGHGDFRRRTDDSVMCSCGSALHLTSRIADGVDQVRHAVRDELRKGADQIKIMVSGGVSSPLDPLEGCQFSNSEIEAAVDEATRAGTYVLAHAYSAEAITRALKAGVRTIEHANLIDKDAAELAAANEIIASATSVGAQVLRREGRLGVIAAGAIADLLVVDGNPLNDISLLAGHGEHYLAIMKEGRFHKNQL